MLKEHGILYKKRKGGEYMSNTKQKGIEVQLTGENGNIFNLVGIVTRALKKEGHRDLAEEIQEKLWDCESYNEALNLLGNYVVVK